MLLQAPSIRAIRTRAQRLINAKEISIMKLETTFDLKKGVKNLFKAAKAEQTHHEVNYIDHGLVSFTDLGFLGHCR